MTRKGPGRPKAEIDLKELEKLCSLNCTDEELAAFFSVTTRTIENKRKEKAYAEVMSRGKAFGRISLRRSQMRLAEAGNATMNIWLGKQLLGQRDDFRDEAKDAEVSIAPDFVVSVTAAEDNEIRLSGNQSNRTPEQRLPVQ